jgi:His/Glu/Gln/Arg/opine family amino acid ABC transporter permease subunit
MSFSDKLYKILIQGGSWKTILGGLWVTIQISALALLIGTVLGALICLLRTRKNPVARGIASVYIAILRGTPVLMMDDSLQDLWAFCVFGAFGQNVMPLGTGRGTFCALCFGAAHDRISMGSNRKKKKKLEKGEKICPRKAH